MFSCSILPAVCRAVRPRQSGHSILLPLCRCLQLRCRPVGDLHTVRPTPCPLCKLAFRLGFTLVHTTTAIFLPTSWSCRHAGAPAGVTQALHTLSLQGAPGAGAAAGRAGAGGVPSSGGAAHSGVHQLRRRGAAVQPGGRGAARAHHRGRRRQRRRWRRHRRCQVCLGVARTVFGRMLLAWCSAAAGIEVVVSYVHAQQCRLCCRPATSSA